MREKETSACVVCISSPLSFLRDWIDSWLLLLLLELVGRITNEASRAHWNFEKWFHLFGSFWWSSRFFNWENGGDPIKSLRRRDGNKEKSFFLPSFSLVHPYLNVSGTNSPGFSEWERIPLLCPHLCAPPSGINIKISEKKEEVKGKRRRREGGRKRRSDPGNFRGHPSSWKKTHSGASLF